MDASVVISWSRAGFLVGLISAVCAAQARADLIDFTLHPTPSAIDEVTSGSLTMSGVTATLSANTGEMNGTGSAFGINGDGSGDATDLLDVAEGVEEAIMITFDRDVEFSRVTVSSFGGNDRGRVAMNGTNFFITSTGTTDFTTNNFIPLGNPVIVSFDSSLGGTSGVGFSIDAFQVNTTAAPEPSMVGLLAVMGAGAGCASCRRRMRGR